MKDRPEPVTPVVGDPRRVVDRFSHPIDSELTTRQVQVDESLLKLLGDRGVYISTDPRSLIDASRDWWPLSIAWANASSVPKRPDALVRPHDVGEISAVLAACNEALVPVTPMAGRSGVNGGSIPAFGGIALDMTDICGVIGFDEDSLVVDVRAGTFGPALEEFLGSTSDGYTLGHWPQSMNLSTVGGWLACRGAGQYSSRYGKIEDMVVGLEVVLSDGRIIQTEGNAPRQAVGPNLTQLFVGSEGTLGVIAAARLRVHPKPTNNARRAFSFESFDEGLETCRRILRRGATPAVLRLYDEFESTGNFATSHSNVLIVFDEADKTLLDATISIVDDEIRNQQSAKRLDDSLVESWFVRRNDVSALAELWSAGLVVDTIEVCARWSQLSPVCRDVLTKIRDIPGTLSASVHQSHSYLDGACLYFTFVGENTGGSVGGSVGGLQQSGGTLDAKIEVSRSQNTQSTFPTGYEWQEAYYCKVWDEVASVILAHGAAISHHHGIGLNRGRFMESALGPTFDVLFELKKALDPNGILNPGKFGLSSLFGEVAWP